MPPKKLTKKEKELALEQERLEREEYEKSVDERVKEIMELPPDEQRITIREFVIANDERRVREKELVDQLRDCVAMLESVRREHYSDSDDELQDLHVRVIGV